MKIEPEGLIFLIDESDVGRCFEEVLDRAIGQVYKLQETFDNDSAEHIHCTYTIKALTIAIDRVYDAQNRLISTCASDERVRSLL